MSEENNPPTEHDFWALKKPNWDDWKSVKQTRLWCAVSLACDLDPDNFMLFNLPQLNTMTQHPPLQFHELLDMAKYSIGAKGPLKLISKSNDGLVESEVSLTNFATWLKTVPHTLPSEFPWQPEAITFLNLDWPWGRHETDLLRKLAEAAHKFWNNYDPSDPTTAPTNKQVIDWLTAQGISGRTAEVMATILRADGLPTGPRK